jgi:FkbM family methyltransferase
MVVTKKIIDNYKFFIRSDTRDCDIVQSCSFNDEYLAEVLQPKNAIVLDLGAHIGGFTVKALHKGASKVYSIEICKENANLLIENVKLNGYSCKNEDDLGETSVVVINKAVHDDDDGIFVDINSSLNKGQTCNIEFQHRYVYNCYDTSNVITDNKSVFFNSISLDTIFNKFNINRVNIVKIDAEGAEWRTLAGASDSTLDKIDIIIGEFNPIPDFYINDKLIKAQKGSDLLLLIGHKFRDTTDNIIPFMNSEQKTWYKNLNQGTGLYLYVLLNKKYNNFSQVKN